MAPNYKNVFTKTIIFVKANIADILSKGTLKIMY